MLVPTLLLAVLAPTAPAPADLVLLNGNVVTVDAQRPRVTAVAVGGATILAAGSDQQIQEYVGSATQVVDLRGRLMIPGFIEGHGHFRALGQSLVQLDLSRAETWDEIVQAVARATHDTPPGQWIVGHGWHQEKWLRRPSPHVDGYPTHDGLSGVASGHPVVLYHGTGHMSVANALAMQLAGVDRDTADPPGGTILRNGLGEPVGVFRETAQQWVDRAYSASRAARTPEEIEAEELRFFEAAATECLRKGITSFQDAGCSLAEVDRYRRYEQQGRLKLRLWLMLNDSNDRLRFALPRYRTGSDGDRYLTIRAIKRMVDGALGSHGAWMLQPYDDLPGSTGLVVTPIDELRETAELAVQHDYQMCVHAIGDRANREVLDLYEQIFREHGDRGDWRWRIEHAQHVDPADLPRFGQLGVVASMQANHCTSDGPFVVRRLGERRAKLSAYAWRSLLDRGAVVINGTDAPVEDVNPLGSFYAAVTRRMRDGNTFFAHQAMTRSEALRSYTLDAAYAAFEDSRKGSITPGKLADLVVLSNDIMSCRPDELPETRVVFTIVGGQIAYAAPEL
jgi:predicted amidohydrolase YtcJ